MSYAPGSESKHRLHLSHFHKLQSGVGFGLTPPSLLADAAGSSEAQDSWSSSGPVDVFAKTEKFADTDFSAEYFQIQKNQTDDGRI